MLLCGGRAMGRAALGRARGDDRYDMELELEERFLPSCAQKVNSSRTHIQR